MRLETVCLGLAIIGNHFVWWSLYWKINYLELIYLDVLPPKHISRDRYLKPKANRSRVMNIHMLIELRFTCEQWCHYILIIIATGWPDKLKIFLSNKISSTPIDLIIHWVHQWSYLDTYHFNISMFRHINLIFQGVSIYADFVAIIDVVGRYLGCDKVYNIFSYLFDIWLTS